MLSLDEALRRFGLTEFRPGQRDIVEAVIAGRPTIAVLPTGAGKSLCYQLPAVALGGLGIVVSPLISLMKDQVDALEARGVAATFINSSIDRAERDARLAAAVRGEVRLLYVAPERFRVPGFTAALARARPVLFAIDEAHCMVEWGHDFRPDYARLGEVRRELAPPRLVALTATATPDVRAEIGAQLEMDEGLVFVRGFDRPNLQLVVMPVQGGEDKLRSLQRMLALPEARGKPAIVYAATRKKAADVAAELRQRGVRAGAYHAGLDDEARARVQDDWMADRLQVVVATNAFGMGVDKRDVRLVVHHDLPGSAEAYYQEAGRAGRDGERARCVLLFNHADVRLREFLINNGSDGQTRPAAVVRAERARLRVMMSYAYAHGCRRAFILGYFGDQVRRCGGDELPCDNCAATAASADPREPGPGAVDDDEHLLVRKVLSCVARVDGGFGRNRVAGCLVGSTAKEVVDAGLDRLSTYGALRGRSHAWTLDVLGTLEAAGLIRAEGEDYPCLRLTPKGREVMLDRARLMLPLPRERAQPARGARGDGERARAVDVDVDAALFERLRRLRAELAAAEKLPAYCVLHDRTLVELARARPGSLEALATIPGIGPAKLAKYGARFLAALGREA